MPIALLFVLVLAGIASAASVTLTPTTIYETTTVWQTIDVDNYGGNSVVQEINVDSDLSVDDAKDYDGWTTSYDASTVEWKDGSIETNVKSAWFEFQVTAPNLNADENETVTVDVDGTDFTFTIEVLDDKTPPNISDVQPDTYARANNAAETVAVTAADPQTGVQSVSYDFNNCNGSDTSVTLTKVNDSYTGTADFSAYNEGDQACYTVKATNNAGEEATVSGTLLFDGTAPSVTQVSPTNYVTETTTFKFTASDNIAATLDCTVYVGAKPIDTVTVNNGSTTQVTKNLTNLTDGSSTWSVTCEDGVGLDATASKAIIIDTKDPSISLDMENTVPRTESETITATVTDANLDDVNITIDGQPVVTNKNGDDYTGTFVKNGTGNATIEVSVYDKAGHHSTVTKTVVVVPNHQLSIDLDPATTTEGKQVEVSGSITEDGNITGSTVTVSTPNGDETVNLAGTDYSTTFNAPSPGTYSISVEYEEQGHTYVATATLTVTGGGQQQQEQEHFSSGPGFDAWRFNGGIAPDDEPEDENSGSNAVVPDEPVEEEPPEDNYEPLDPEEPRQAITPSATGVFNLGGAVKWALIFAVLAGIVAAGVYAYRNRPPKKEEIDWDSYFDGPRTNN